MKIALVSPYDYSFPGGVTEHIAHLERCFTAAGHDVRVIAPSSDEQIEERLPHVYRVGRHIIELPTNRSIARISLSLRLSQRIRCILEDERFDVVHLHEPFVPTLPLTVLKYSEAANVGTFHASRRSYFGYSYGRPFLRRYVARLHGWIAVSQAAREFVRRYFPADYVIIPNGIDVAAYQRTRPRLPVVQDGKINLLFVGRLEKRKGLVFLLRSLPYVKRHFPNLRLIVVGAFEQEQLAEYRAIIEQAGLRDVVFEGLVSTEEKIAYYQGCDIFCAPAIGSESQGVVLLEAMAAGKPVVATDIEGYRSVVTDGEQGLLVPPADEAALAVALARLLADPGLRARLGAAGRERAQQYDWVKVARRVLEYYEVVVDRRRQEVAAAPAVARLPRLGVGA